MEKKKGRRRGIKRKKGVKKRGGQGWRGRDMERGRGATILALIFPTSSLVSSKFQHEVGRRCRVRKVGILPQKYF